MIPRNFFPHLQVEGTFPVVNILDVTLRDGSFAVDFKWTEDGVRGITHALAKAAIPYIELGYYGGGVPEPPYVQDKGLTGNVPLHLVQELASEHPSTNFALMIHPDAIQQTIDFQKIKQSGLMLVRFVYHPAWADAFKQLLRAAQDVGLQTSINLSLSSRYDLESLLQLCSELSQLSPSILYLADTCAAFYPHQVTSLFTQLVTNIDTPLGFHAHDFLSLAFANSLAAAHAGATYIDASLLGMGRGAGNLRSEIWCMSSIAQQKGMFLVDHLLPAIRHIHQYTVKNEQDIMSIASAVCNLTPPEEQLLRDVALKAGDADASLLACRYVRNRLSLPHLTEDGLRALLES
jgi:4-hydroxy 2-oxovalerate aldolase